MYTENWIFRVCSEKREKESETKKIERHNKDREKLKEKEKKKKKIYRIQEKGTHKAGS